MLIIKNLFKKYGKFQALDNLNMTIPDGSLYGFIGPNGAGKTTTVRILSGLCLPDKGSAVLDGEDIVIHHKNVKAKIGYVPDYFGIYDNLKVGEYMEFFASCYQLDGFAARKRCQALLEQVGLEDKTDFYVDGLSRGMQQRLCLARALIHDPGMLILDEPTSGLDPRTRYEFKEILKELREQGKTILISSHILSELSEICTDIGIIDQGKLVLEGNMDDILSQVNTSRPLTISIIGNISIALQILKSRPDVQTITVRDHDIVVGFEGDPQEEAMLLQQLIDADVLVRSFTREQGSLESVFMQITNQEEDKAVLIHEN